MRGKKLLKLIDFYIGNILIFLLYFFSYFKKIILKNRVNNSVAILSFGAIGDSLLILSVLERMNFKQKTKITVFCTPENSHVFKYFCNNPNIKIEIIELYKISRYFKLGFWSFDFVYDFNQWLNISSIISFFIGRNTIGFKTYGFFRHIITDRFVNHSNCVHEIENFANLAGIKLGAFKKPAFLKSSVNNHRIPQKVIIHPFAGGYKAEMRELPLDYWNRIIKFLTDKEIHVYLSGSKLDSKRYFYVKQCDYFHDIRGKLTLLELKNFIDDSHLIISVNTGIMHLASLMNLNLLCINGPTQNIRWGPLNPRSKTIDLPKKFGGDFLNLGFEYPRGYTYSMNNLSVKKILNTIDLLL